MHRQLQVYGCVHTHECTRVCACHCLRVYGTQDTDGNGERSKVGQFVSSRQHRSYVQARRGHTCTYLASGCEPACRSRMRHPFTILQSIAVIVGNGRDLYVLRCARMQPDTADSTYGVADTLRRGDHPLATPDTRHQPANMPVLLGFVVKKTDPTTMYTARTRSLYWALWRPISAVMEKPDDMAFQLRAAPPQRQTVYYTHTGGTVVATHEFCSHVLPCLCNNPCVSCNDSHTCA